MRQEKCTMFMRLHPMTNVVYFIGMMMVTMFYMHPVLLGISVLVCFVYVAYLSEMQDVKKNLLMLPFVVLLGIINPIFNRNGSTVLFYFQKKPVTFEAVVYGFLAAVMIYNMILVFQVFHKVMNSDKIMAVFSKIFPSGALLFTMTLRFVPLYKNQLIKMRIAQKGIGQDVTQGSKKQRIHYGISLISGLMTWALENALVTSDSMKGRGYGLKGRTSYIKEDFTKLDCFVLMAEVLGLVLTVIGMLQQVFRVSYYPAIHWKLKGTKEMFFYCVFGIYAMIPLIVDAKEEITWFYLKQKI
ncbi:energy-coupling factor transporter transmembrane component T [[Clostridium] polysaccharolyticum]|uniref:Energy-coupling factor transport system permease protein n=1 Tax=[Clostridium] polysaccharolyticum TaxID=29364 RepID=A0A1H9ZPM3_9FIRM|nr:energy-coupling factor transporter transmembrane component T [[Clostridium] polysaccharolyticum]SES83531.1 energy-coupling factor transport system permease protein [[Clostridium] polysaccharolyticum]